jgi:hypothetical protein
MKTDVIKNIVIGILAVLSGFVGFKEEWQQKFRHFFKFAF